MIISLGHNLPIIQNISKPSAISLYSKECRNTWLVVTAPGFVFPSPRVRASVVIMSIKGRVTHLIGCSVSLSAAVSKRNPPQNHKVKKARVMSQHCLSKHLDFHISSLFANENVEYNFYDNSLYKSKLNINALKCTHCEQS